MPYTGLKQKLEGIRYVHLIIKDKSNGLLHEVAVKTSDLAQLFRVNETEFHLLSNDEIRFRVDFLNILANCPCPQIFEEAIYKALKVDEVLKLFNRVLRNGPIKVEHHDLGKLWKWDRNVRTIYVDPRYSRLIDKRIIAIITALNNIEADTAFLTVVRSARHGNVDRSHFIRRLQVLNYHINMRVAQAINSGYQNKLFPIVPEKQPKNFELYLSSHEDYTRAYGEMFENI